MSLNYRSLFEVPAEVDPFVLARGQFRTWLRTKMADTRSTVIVDEWDGQGIHHMGESARLVDISEVEHDGSRLLRLELDETNLNGRWMTTLTVAVRGRQRGPWSRFLWVETSQEDLKGDALDRVPFPPRLIRNILGAVTGIDGEARVTARPQVIRASEPRDVESLLNALTDTQRRMPAVVAGAVENDLAPQWLEAVADLVWPGIGLVSSAVLDGEAHDAVNRALGPTHRVPRRGVRTYLPGVDTDDPSDALRHRFVTPGTMADAIVRDGGKIRVRPGLSRAVAWNARRVIMHKSLPAPVRRVDQILKRAEERAHVQAAPRTGRHYPLPSPEPQVEATPVEPVAPSTPEAASGESAVFQRLHEMVGMTFGVSEPTVEHVVKFSQIVSALAKDVPDLEEDNKVYEGLLEASAAEVGELREQLEQAAKRSAELELEAAVAEDERRRNEGARAVAPTEVHRNEELRSSRRSAGTANSG